MYFFFVGCQKLSKIFRNGSCWGHVLYGFAWASWKDAIYELNGSQNPGTLGAFKIAG